MSDITGITTQSSATDGATALAGIKTTVTNLDTDKLEAASVAALTAKTTPVNADTFPITDTQASNVLKKLSFTNLKAFLKTYFDGLYPGGSGTSTGANTGDQTLSDATISTTDITTNNVSISKHGFVPKAPNDATKFLDGLGAYSVPPGGSIAFKNGVTSRAGNTASGTQNIAHGLGATPKYVKLTAFKSTVNGTASFMAHSLGVYNGTTNSVVYGAWKWTAVALETNTNGGNCIYIGDAGATGLLQAAVATFDATNIILTWTMTSTPDASTIYIMWEAIG